MRKYILIFVVFIMEVGFSAVSAQSATAPGLSKKAANEKPQSGKSASSKQIPGSKPAGNEKGDKKSPTTTANQQDAPGMRRANK